MVLPEEPPLPSEMGECVSDDEVRMVDHLMEEHKVLMERLTTEAREALKVELRAYVRELFIQARIETLLMQLRK